MDLKYKIRINGRAPAWPVLLGEEHPFYDPEDPDALGSASYSLIASDENDIRWELLIDAGHNTVPFLLKHSNRIPDALFLTHAHPDHILGVDWIVQSHYRRNSGREAYPVYCTQGTMNLLLKQYSHITGLVRHVELIPGQKTTVQEAAGFFVTAFPVYHGEGAKGASMLFFEQDTFNGNIVITGDLLIPLLRKKDISTLSKARKLFIDTNNRFPDPESNHISFARILPGSQEEPSRLKKWILQVKLRDLLVPHQGLSNQHRQYFEEFVADWNVASDLPFTTLDLLKLSTIPQVYLTHYWGWYDRWNYSEAILDEQTLLEWARNTAINSGLPDIEIFVPKVGEFIDL